MLNKWLNKKGFEHQRNKIIKRLNLIYKLKVCFADHLLDFKATKEKNYLKNQNPQIKRTIIFKQIKNYTETKIQENIKGYEQKK